MKRLYKAAMPALAVILTGFALIGASPAYTPPVCPQDDGFDRSKCLADCRQTFLGDYSSNLLDDETAQLQWGRGGGGDNGTILRLYYKCITDCENKFWQKFDKESDDLMK
jgi:hypothetical protein